MALGDVIARLAVHLGIETAAFEQGATIAEKRLEQTRKKLEKIGGRMSDIGAKMSIGITAPIAALAAKGVQEARETALAIGQVEAALASMGPVSGKTAEELSKTADALEKGSLFEADQILRDITANLLTFGNVAGEQFDRAQQAAVDMATRLNIGPKEAAIQLGKALNDPIKGIAALGRSGIQFSEDQKAVIRSLTETGQTAAAQNLILAELERQFGGAAQAAQNADPINKFNDALNQLAEVVGTKLLPHLTPLVEKMAAGVEWFTKLPTPVQDTVLVATALSAALGPVLMVFGNLLPLLVKLGPVIGVISKALLFLAANPVILGLAAVIGGIYLAWKNWDKIEAIVRNLYNAVKTWVVDKLNAVWDTVKAGIDRVKGFFYGLWDAVVGNSYIPDMVDGIGHHMARLQGLMVDPAQKATKVTAQAFRDMAAETHSLLDRLFPEIAKANGLKKDLGLIAQSGLSSTQQMEARRRLYLQNGALGNVVPINSDVAEKLEADLVRPAQEATVRVAKSFDDMARNVINSVRSFTDAIKGGSFIDILGSIIDVFSQLGATGLFGGKIQSNIQNFGGFRAAGGSVLPGKSYIVGENGPEWFSPSRSGHIVPNNDNGGSRVQIVPSPYFDVVVDGRAQRVAAPMATEAAQVGAMMARAGDARSRKWSLR